MTETTPNLDLLDRVMDHIDQHPEEWKQSYWITATTCGTAACFAGHACLMEGWQLFPVSRFGSYRFEMVAKDGAVNDVRDVAVALLGLDEKQAERLFGATNTLDDLHSMVKQIHGAPYETLSWETS